MTALPHAPHLAFVAALVALASCAQEVQEPAPKGESELVAAPPPEASYALHVDAPQAAQARRASLAKVSVTPTLPWHINLDFPVRLELAAPDGVMVPTDDLGKEHAERFDADALVFSVPFTGQTGGPKQFAGAVHFAVCAQEACAPQEVPIEFTVDIRCSDADSGNLC